MQLTHNNGVFTCICSYAEKDIPKSAGFVWDRIVPKTWSTKDASVAYKLLNIATQDACSAIKKQMEAVTQNIEASKASESSADIPCPAGLEYLPYQKAGIAFITSQLQTLRSGVLLADDMGLGKTIQAIGVINVLESKQNQLPLILVVCPASLKRNWNQELTKWLVKPNVIAEVSSDSDWEIANIYIVNYDILIQPCPACRGKSKEEKKVCPSCQGTGSYKKFPLLFEIEWDLIIADESHRLKSGNKSKQARAFFELKTKYKLPMTGTPILSKPIEIWSTLSWLDNSTCGNWFKFAARYCNMQATRFGRDVSGSSNLGELQHRLRGGGYMIRRLKADVLKELPPKFRQVIELPSSGLDSIVTAEWNAFHKCESLIEKLRVSFELAKASEYEEDYHNAVESLRKGQSAAFAEMALIRKEVAIAKLPFVVQHIKDCASSEHKLVVFMWHIEIAEELVKQFSPHCVCITGDTNVNIRQDLVNRFQTDDDTFLFIGNMKAAGVGLTLTKSSHVVFAELDWVPANITQAEDRCHRISQLNNVLVQHLVLAGSLDSVMARRIIEKQKIVKQALDVDNYVPNILESSDEKDKPVTRKEVVVYSVELSQEDISVIHMALKHLSALCNHARSIDGMGFSKIDSEIGHSLANAPRLTQKQAYLGLKLAVRHSRQLHDSVREALKNISAKAKGDKCNS